MPHKTLQKVHRYFIAKGALNAYISDCHLDPIRCSIANLQLLRSSTCNLNTQRTKKREAMRRTPVTKSKSMHSDLSVPRLGQSNHALQSCLKQDIPGIQSFKRALIEYNDLNPMLAPFCPVASKPAEIAPDHCLR